MRKRTKLFWSGAALAGAISYLKYQNTALTTTYYELPVAQLPEALDGLRIVHLSDLHLPLHRVSLQRLLLAVRDQEPDLIVITGDLIFGRKPYDRVVMRSFLSELTKQAPVYATFGNHEKFYRWRQELEEDLHVSGVHYLCDQAVWHPVADSGLVLLGLEEKSARLMQQTDLLAPISLAQLTEQQRSSTRVLLAHCPERFLQYHVDQEKLPHITFVGHAHGGQIRVPFVGGLFAPGQGLLPKYTEGVFHHPLLPDKLLVVSRGIGSSSFPFRINNRPEVVVATLRPTQLEKESPNA